MKNSYLNKNLSSKNLHHNNNKHHHNHKLKLKLKLKLKKWGFGSIDICNSIISLSSKIFTITTNITITMNHHKRINPKIFFFGTP
jgi:hypothetical protein